MVFPWTVLGQFIRNARKNNMTLHERMIRSISELMDIPEEEMKPESDLYEDLGLDSLDGVELMMALEEEFEDQGLEIDDSEAEGVRTVAQLEAVLRRKMPKVE